MCNSVNQGQLCTKNHGKSSVNDFDLLTQAFVYYVSNTGHQSHWKKADLKRSKYVESLAKESLPWINDISIEIKCKKVKFLI